MKNQAPDTTQMTTVYMCPSNAPMRVGTGLLGQSDITTDEHIARPGDVPTERGVSIPLRNRLGDDIAEIVVDLPGVEEPHAVHGLLRNRIVYRHRR